MGSGSSKSHEAFGVAPSSEPEAVEPATDADAEEWAEATTTVSTAISNISTAVSYQDLVGATHAAATAIQHSDLPPQLKSEATEGVQAATKAWLLEQPADELVEQAKKLGFEHADFVSHKAVAHVLDPNFPDNGDSKHKILAKAQERHDNQVAAGNLTVLAPAEAPDGTWVATPADVVEAQAAFTDAVVNLTSSPQDAAAYGQLIQAENKLATAYCPQAADQLAAATASAKSAVDALTVKNPYAVGAWINGGIADGTIPAGVDKTLSRSEITQLARSSTSPADHAALLEQHASRAAQFKAWQDSHNKLESLCGAFGWAGVTPHPFTSAADVTAFTAAAKNYYGTHADVAEWDKHGLVHSPSGTHLVGAMATIKGFKAATKPLPLSELRAAAMASGLDADLAKTASRAQLANYLGLDLGTKDNLSAATITADLTSKLAQKQAPKPPPSPATPVAAPQPASSASGAPSTHPASTSPTAGSGVWYRKHKQLVDALKHQTATLGDLPPRPDTGEVAAWQFKPGPAMSLGGAHTKSVHTAPDGSAWMFKPDKHGGARATAESAANQILHRVGIPTIPVYARNVDGKPGTVQPLLKGASQLSSNPKHWSQADVDAIVRYHAAAWLVGDHDAKHDNILRTPGGGLVPIDHGQAFKFYGQDKLSSDYHPNASFGAQPPIWNSLYKAAKSGGLAPGVKVRPAAAIPVIKAVESIPDHEYSGMLVATAKAGSANNAIHWRDTMRKRATAKGHSNPTDAQIADEFVAHGLERKQTLRSTFAAFFAAEKVDNADMITKVA